MSTTIVEDILRLARDLTPQERLRVIEQITPDVEVPLNSGPAIHTHATFEQLMAEAQSDTVAVGHMDDSREAMYTRTNNE